MDEDLERLKRYIELSYRHCYFLKRADKKLSNAKSEDDYIETTDVLTTRFQKLQSIIAEKILPTLLRILGEDTSKPFIELYNKALKLDIVNIEFYKWQELRDERNTISHGDYEILEFDKLRLNIDSFRKEEVGELLKVYQHILKFISSKIQIDLEIKCV